MKDFHFAAALIGFGLAASILYLVRRDHLYLRDGLFWIVVALVSLLMGVWPGVIDVVGAWVGIAYPPAFLFIVAILVLLVRSLIADITTTRLLRDLRRLNQRMAMYEAGQAPDAARDRSNEASGTTA